MEELTLEQKQAIAIASARARAAATPKRLGAMDTMGGAILKGLQDVGSGLAEPFVGLGREMAQGYEETTAKLNRPPPSLAGALRETGQDLSRTGRQIGSVLNLPTAPLRAGIRPIADALSRAPIQAYAPPSLNHGREGLAPRPLNREETQQTLEGALLTALSASPEAAGAITGAAIKPVAASGKFIANRVAAPAASTFLGATTGVGPTAIREAVSAGRRGGEQAKAFTQNMRGGGDVSVSDIVPQARSALENLRQARSAQYRAGTDEIFKDPTVLNFDDIESAVENVRNRGQYKGQRIDKSADNVWQQIDKEITDWKALDPEEYHTPEGMDALKKSLGDILDSTQEGTPAHNAASTVYSAVKSEIVKQAPGYGRIMSDYEKATDELRNITRGLSLNRKASVDTSVRKLQSILRGNVSSGFGSRAEMARVLEQNGAETLFPSVAGQAMSSLLPRGLSGPAEGVAGAIALKGGGLAALLHPGAIAAALSASPRLVGEGALAFGSTARKVDEIANAMSKAGVTATGAIKAAILAALLSQDRQKQGPAQ